MLNEVITIGGIDYIVQNICMRLNTISFVVQEMTVNEVEAAFKNVTALCVKSENGEVYGEYPNVVYASVIKDAKGDVTVTMRIPTLMELQIVELQRSQAEQDEVIAELFYGGGED